MKLGIATALTAAVGLAAAAIGIYLSSSHEEAAAPGMPFGRGGTPRAVPELQLVDGAGRAHSLAELRGKTVLLNIWATWCAPCRKEMPALDRLQAKLGGSAFQVVALSIDREGAAIVHKFFKETGIRRLEPYIDPSAQAAFKLNAVGLPTTLLIGRDGRELARHAGPVEWDSPEVVEDLRQRANEGRPH